ncbi:hypothetical protein GUY44_13970 [Pimelobacter simplex]|uniref:hypothetical protein n=1 Tax=Nocardioides simplex TaxID=2045 RepID=UPI000535CD20|nr:hypothetical protein [Pimelobacter simplex]MCG8151594.1 hypothetical protein [Pimelobacter simplex]GEB13223.1 hypothetical protein NSI01_15380 [Pimelobacter simplex]SFM47873.1 hypothetical protein SAMN05421671_1809 [Pimelobacter simplex]
MRPRDLTGALVVPPVLGAVLGAAGGWLWWAWWGPAPQGKIYDTTAGPHWYPDPFDPGITRDFSGTATYVVVGFGLALLLGLVSGWLARKVAVPGLLALLVGAGLATLLMYLIGESFSPPDPASLAAAKKIGAVLPGHLHVSGWTPYLAWPVGALLGYLVVLLSLTSESQPPARPSSVPAPQG